MTTTLDWYGCATFRMRTAGLTIFLDAYIDRVPDAPGPGLVADDIDECDWIVVGHSHFDHLWGAERIAANTGAKVVGSYESIRVLADFGVPMEQMICVAGGEKVDLGNGVTVDVFPSQHSCVWSHTEPIGSAQVCLGDEGVTLQEQRQRMAGLSDWFRSLGSETIAHIKESNQGARGDGGALVFLFTMPDGSVLYQDTSGHWSGILDGLRPDVAIMAAAGRGNVNGDPIQGSLAEFIGNQAALLQPKRVVLGHHDDWLPGFSTPTDVAPIAAALEAAVPGLELLEPDYLDATIILPLSQILL